MPGGGCYKAIIESTPVYVHPSSTLLGEQAEWVGLSRTRSLPQRASTCTGPQALSRSGSQRLYRPFSRWQAPEVPCQKTEAGAHKAFTQQVCR